MDENTENNLFIIYRIENYLEDFVLKSKVLKVYYCLFGFFYCAPTTKQISDSRLTDSLKYIDEAVDKYFDIRFTDNEEKNNKVEDTTFVTNIIKDFVKDYKL